MTVRRGNEWPSSIIAHWFLIYQLSLHDSGDNPIE
jgi:hypothetical protein